MSKRINITITGALGRMGKILVKCTLKNKKFKLYSLTDLKFGQRVEGVKVQDNCLEAFKKTDVIIDFSTPRSAIEILHLAVKLKKKNNHRNNWFYQKTRIFNKKIFKKNCNI
jgi:4-hydroxy-tetrahydrodipicolinate reductase